MELPVNIQLKWATASSFLMVIDGNEIWMPYDDLFDLAEFMREASRPIQERQSRSSHHVVVYGKDITYD